MSDSTMVPVGERIKAIREEQGLTLQALADKTGYSSALINQIENHMISPPLGALGNISNALEVPIGALWGDTTATTRHSLLVSQVPGLAR